MDYARLRYLFGDVIKISLIVSLLGAVAFGFYLYINRDNDIYGQLPKQYFQNALTNPVTWDSSQISIDKPSQEAVFKVKKRSISRKEAWDLAKKLELPIQGKVTLESDGKEFFSTTNGDKELVVGLTNGSVHFKYSKAITESKTGLKFSEERLMTEVRKQISALGLSADIYNLQKPAYEFFKTDASSNHLTETQIEKANIAYSNFKREIDGISIVTVGGAERLSLGFNSEYQLISLNYSIFEIEDNQAVYKLISEGSAKSKIKKGQGKFNRFLEDPEHVSLSPSAIVVGDGVVSFYDDKKSAYIQPVYVFEAQATDGDKSVKAEIYLPALSDVYFEK